MPATTTRARRFPRGDAVTLAALDVDPYPILAELREHEPVSWVPEVGMWFVTGRDDCVAVLSDHETYTVDSPNSVIRDIFGRHMMTIDGDEQVRHKRACMPPFKPKHLQSVEPDIAADVRGAILAFATEGRAELRSRLARPLAVRTVTRILGLPAEAVEAIGGWYDRFAEALANFTGNPAIRKSGHAASREFGDLVGDTLAGFEPPGDASLLERLDDASDGLTGDEIVANAHIIMFGGIETTEAAICNAVWALLSHPQQHAAAQSEPTLLPNAIEESLRWEPAVQSCTRHTTRDVELHDVAIAAGETVQCMLGAANRDPAWFADPDRFDIRRANAREHLSFGLARHFCIGAALARMEVSLAVRGLWEHCPALALDTSRPAAPRGYEFRKPSTLWVRWTM